MNVNLNLKKEYISMKLKEQVDNVVFQRIRGIVQDIKLYNDDILFIKVDSCPHCKKQRIAIEDYERAEDFNDCMWYMDKSIDDTIVVYKNNGEITYALQSELNAA